MYQSQLMTEFIADMAIEEKEDPIEA